jgi:hypothetical protein
VQSLNVEEWKLFGVSRYPPSGTVHRSTFGGSEAGNKHLEVATW